MNFSVNIEIEGGDELIVSLISVGSVCDIEIIEVSLIRKTGTGVIPIRTFKKISEIVMNVLSRSGNAILFYLCDRQEDIPRLRKTRTIMGCNYRDRLFSLLFQRYSERDWKDYRIEAQMKDGQLIGHIIFQENMEGSIPLVMNEVERIIYDVDNQK